MSDTPQLTVIITGPRRVQALDGICQSLIRQQNAPPFEVLVVCNTANSKVERLMQGFDWRFRYICADSADDEDTWRTALAVAIGEVVVFIDSECRIDEPHFLKHHFEQHQRSSNAIGIGGRAKLSANANAFQATWFWMLDFWLSQARIDALRCAHLSKLNCSYKTHRLREFLRENPAGPMLRIQQNIPLDVQLFAAGLELHWIDRLNVEYRPDIQFIGLLQRAFNQGRMRYAIEQLGLASAYRYPGFQLSLRSNVIERGGKISWAVGHLFRLAELAEQVGFGSVGSKTVATAKTSAIVGGATNLAWQRLLKLPYSSVATELFFALRYCIFRL